jgi:hypothetical protein
MLPFSPVSIDNVMRLQPFVQAQPFRFCDYTVGTIFQWRAYFSTCFAIQDNMLHVSVDYPGEGRYYGFPIGTGDISSALDAIEEDALSRGQALRFCCVPVEAVALFEERYKDRCLLSTRRDWADYLYNAEDLIYFPGKRYHTQRNHLNRFTRDNPNARFVQVDENTLAHAIAFLDGYERHMPAHKVIEAEEMRRSKELLRYATCLNQQAGYIETDGTVVAMAIGEVVGDTLYVHVEKARVDYPGAYQAIVSQFAASAYTPALRYINREDDSGEEGLRYSKMAYRPIRLIDKYWATIRSNNT